MKKRMEKSDVLIIGGGVAALRSAVEASKAGVNVTVLIKSGATCSAGLVGFNACMKNNSSGDSPSKYFNDMFIGGEFLNDPKLVSTVVYNSENEVNKLLEMGVQFDRKNDLLAVRQAAGSSYARTLHHQDKIGPEMMNIFLKYLSENNVKVCRGTVAIELIKNKERVIGALAVDKQNKELVTYLAKTTIIATGGAGNLYSFTTNPKGVTGDGYIMAHKVGAKLRDMEFVQFEPFIMVYPEDLVSWSVPTTLLWDGAKIYNTKGVEFLPKDSNGKVLPFTKDKLSRMIYQEVQAGNGTEHGGVFMDLSVLPEEILDNYPTYLKHCQVNGVDPKKTPVEIAPAHHYMMGGIVIDENCKTNVSGLYAAGEVAGGVHGADRLAGNAGIDVLVFGSIAGEQAAKEAISTPPDYIDSFNDEEYVSETISLISNEINEIDEAQKLLGELQELMWSNVGIVRESSKMETAIAWIADSTNNIEILKVNNVIDLIDLVEVRNAFELAKIVTNGALQRKESRGDHYRSDYPERNDINWLKSSVI